MTTQRKIALVVAILLVVAAGAAFYLYKKTTQPPSETGTQNGNPITITAVGGAPGNATVTVVERLNAELYDKTPKPSLTRAFPQGNMPADEYKIFLSKHDKAIAAIKANPAFMENYLTLGTLYKQIGDYEGARMYFTYVATVSPQNLAAHWDLGTLNENYLKDYAKAESEFRTAIALEPAYISAYIELATMFVNINAKDKAKTILAQGLVKNPTSIDILVAQAQVYTSLGDTNGAKQSYDKAIALAQKDGNTNLVASLTADKNALK